MQCNHGRSDSKRFGVLHSADIRRANETIVREFHSILTGEREICPEMAHMSDDDWRKWWKFTNVGRIFL